jgi:lysophosphatidic acid phosphatase type 6
MELVSVVVLHRHGDRSQIAKATGPIHPITAELEDAYVTQMPSLQSLRLMLSAATEETVEDPASKGTLEGGERPDFSNGVGKGAKEVRGVGVGIGLGLAVVEEMEVYSGWERKNYPFGMLTERGFLQMRDVGRELRRRYIDSAILPSTDPNPNLLYCRSTNFCRTKQSLRSLLTGLLDIPEVEMKNEIKSNSSSSSTGGGVDKDTSRASTTRRTPGAPVIHTRLKSQETMFASSSGPCSAAQELRRAELFADDFLAENWEGYNSLHETFSTVFGFSEAEEEVNWLTVREVLTCHSVHGVPLPEPITEGHVHKVNHLSGFIWNRLFDDFVMNRYAIGRFVNEMLADLDASVMGARAAKMLVYSGHDSTMVPMLCALGISSGEWPPYASHLEVEVARRKADGALFARAIFNNEEMLMKGAKALWSPYFRFQRLLRELALTPDQYQAECKRIGLDNPDDEDGLEGDGKGKGGFSP